MKWEYNRMVVASEEGVGPLDDDFVYEFMQRLGKENWELVTVSDGVAYFKRPREDNGEEEAVKEAHSEEDTDQPQRCSTAGQLYSRAYE